MREGCLAEGHALAVARVYERAMLETITVTVLVVCVFIASKNTLDSLWRRWARLTVVVVGAGPVGLIAVLIAARNSKVARIILYDERTRKDLLNRPQQIAVERKNVQYLTDLGVDFDNIEGCWQHQCFYTRIGVFQEYVLSILYRLPKQIDVRLSCKFTKDTVRELDQLPGRLLVIACDGTHGHSATLLGVSDEFIQHSCKAYGAVAALARPEERQIPTPEIRIHNLTFDLNAFGNDCSDDPHPQGFHFKIFGGYRYRYMALIVPKCESKLVKFLKVVLDQTIMRNIFQLCFNTYKTDTENKLTDKAALKMKFSPRLFEIRLSQRIETVAYIEDANLFVVTEGDAAACLNFHTGRDINFSIKSLHSMDKFISQAATASTENAILEVLNQKHAHSRALVQEFLRSGLRETMYS